MNINKIRSDFPILEDSRVVYFDTACQSLRPQSVIDAVTGYYEDLSACSGRSMHHLAAEVTQKCNEARAKLARFVNAAKT